MPSEQPIRPADGGVTLALAVVPRAPRREIAGLLGNAIRVRLQSPPVDGRANEDLVDLLAARLGVAPAAVRIVAGAGGRRKIVHVSGVTVDDARRRLGLPPLG